MQGFNGAKHVIEVSPEQTKALRELSRREGVTLFMTMLSAFVLLLNRYTGDEDLVVGSTYANREREEAERLIGILTTALVLRVDLSGADTFREALRRVREVCLDAYAYQVPPELLLEDLRRKSGERERLFDVWFQVERERREKLAMQGLEVEPYVEGKEVTKFELSMVLVEREEEIAGILEYDQNIFTARSTAQMLEDYFSLLALMTADPQRALSTISLASEAENEELRSGFTANLEV